jgi:hypothetical protein
MRIANIILTHKNPSQLEKMIVALRHVDFDFYIHVDKKVNIRDFEFLQEMSQVYFIKDRTVCNWGGFSLVEAIIKSIEQIDQTEIAYDFVNLMSAQDYPIQPVAKIREFFNANRGYSFLSFDESRDSSWWQNAEKRYANFHFTDMNFRGKYVVQALANTLMSTRKFPVPITLFGGNKSCWWTITKEAAVYLAAYLRANPKIMSFLKLTWGSDEFIVASILMNSPFKEKIINENYRFIDWTDGLAHPKILCSADYHRITESKMLFARKFDIAVDAKIIQLLDTQQLKLQSTE